MEDTKMNINPIQNTNVYNNDTTETIIGNTLKVISSMISKSLGPFGANTIIEDLTTNHKITKDGYTILNGMKFSHPIMQATYDIIKRVSRNLVAEVGDGSTSATIVAAGLYSILKSEIFKNVNYSPRIILDMMKDIEKVISKMVMEMAIPIISEDGTGNWDKLKDIATISNNNDEVLGALVTEIYEQIGKDGFINLEFSKSSETTYEIANGYTMDSGYIDEIFCNSGSTKVSEKFERNGCYVLIANDYLTSEELPMLQNFTELCCVKNASALAIIAKGFDEDAYTFFKVNKRRNPDLAICAIDVALATDGQKAYLNDIAVYTGSTIYDLTDNTFKGTEDVLGYVDHITVTSKETKFLSTINLKKEEINTYCNEMIISKLEEYKKYKGASNQYDKEIYSLEKRLAKLTAKSAILYIGGDSFIEKENRRYLIEDSIFACKSALKYGYIIGGNLIIPFILNDEQKRKLIEDTIYEKWKDRMNTGKNNTDAFRRSIISDILSCISDSFLSVYGITLSNYTLDKSFVQRIIETSVSNKCIYNLNTHRYEGIDSPQTDIETKVINSPQTDIEIMKASFSIIGLLAYSNQFIEYSIRK